MSEQPISLLMVRLAEYHATTGEPPIKDRVAEYTIEVRGEPCTLYVNGHPKPVEVRGSEVPAFHGVAYRLGWPLLLFGPYMGVGMVGAEDALIEALEGRITAAGGSMAQEVRGRQLDAPSMELGL